MDPPRDRRPRRIGVFGGTFNPIHYGHLRVADAVRRTLDLDEVRMVPAGRPPHKLGDESVAPAADRLAMTRLACEEFPGLVASDVEIARAGPSFTVETLAAIRRDVGPDARLFLLVGADTWPELPTWHRAAELAELADVVVVNRPGRPIETTEALERVFGAERARRIVASAVHVRPQAESATEIRDRIAAGLPVDGWTPRSVVRYIGEKNLFRRGPSPDAGE